jgi:iron complex outermembrane receptor protein
MMGAPLRSYVGVFGNYMEQEGHTFANLNDFSGNRGVLTQKNRASITNLGARARADWDFVPRWTAAAGVGYENSSIRATVNRYTNAGAPQPTDPIVDLDRTFVNVAPELSLTHENSRDTRQWARVSTGYAIPGIGNLTTGTDGQPGINFDLKPQKNLGFELGTDTAFGPRASLQLVGFLINFRDEIITQNVLGGSSAVAVNADKSQYRGIEVATALKPAKGVQITGAYSLMDATYTRFDDQYVVAGVETPVSRDGNEIPAVEKNVLDAKIAYDHPSGFGVWIEGYWAGEFYVNNSNTLEAPGYGLMHVNMHHNYTFASGPIRYVKAFAQVNNLFDRTYVSSAGVVADSPTDTPTTLRTTKQSFFAGYGRSVYGGITVGF